MFQLTQEILELEFPYSVVEETARTLYGRALKKYPPDLVQAIEDAYERETQEVAKNISS